MGVTSERASELLDQVDYVARTTRDRAIYDGVGPILILWGVIWTVCFCVTHFAPTAFAWTWLIADAVGIPATVYLGWIRPRGGPILSESAKRQGRKLLWFWFLALVYGSIWLVILWPWRTEQFGLFWVTFVMFAYVVMGLWFEMRFLLWLGVAVTLITAGGSILLFLFVPGYLNLWLGLSGGLSLAGSGLHLMRRERSRHA